MIARTRRASGCLRTPGLLRYSKALLAVCCHRPAACCRYAGRGRASMVSSWPGEGRERAAVPSRVVLGWTCRISKDKAREGHAYRKRKLGWESRIKLQDAKKEKGEGREGKG